MMIHAMGDDTCNGRPQASPKKNPSDISFSFQLIADVRSMIYIVLFQAVNALGTLLANIMEIDKYKLYEEASTTFRNNRIDRQSKAANIA